LKENFFPQNKESFKILVITWPYSFTMRLRKDTFVAIVWIALCAILMAALAPSVSHMMASQRQEASPACHLAVHQSQHLHSDTNKTTATLALDDCGYCSMQAQLPILPTLLHNAGTVIDLIRFVPPLFLFSPQPLFAWLHAQPRAPPAR